MHWVYYWNYPTLAKSFNTFWIAYFFSSVTFLFFITILWNFLFLKTHWLHSKFYSYFLWFLLYFYHVWSYRQPYFCYAFLSILNFTFFIICMTCFLFSLETIYHKPWGKYYEINCNIHWHSYYWHPTYVNAGQILSKHHHLYLVQILQCRYLNSL